MDEGDACDSDDDNDGSPDVDSMPSLWSRPPLLIPMVMVSPTTGTIATELQIAASGLTRDDDDDGDGVSDHKMATRPNGVGDQDGDGVSDATDNHKHANKQPF